MGLFSRKKDKGSSNQEMEFLGVSGQASTIKCLILAGIKEVPLRATFAPSDVEVDQTHSYQYLAPFEMAPTLTHGDFTTAGANAIMTYVDIRGTGMSLNPKKARTLGQQNYWITVCYEQLAPAVQEVVNGSPSDDAKNLCNEVLTSLNNSLGENLFVVGPLSLADPHVAAYIYVLRANGADLSPYTNIAAWITRLEGEMSADLKGKYLPMMTASAQAQVA